MNKWVSNDFQLPNYCEDCIHWHKRKRDPVHWIWIGDCDKFKDMITFENECHNDNEFHCFEGSNKG